MYSIQTPLYSRSLPPRSWGIDLTVVEYAVLAADSAVVCQHWNRLFGAAMAVELYLL